MTMEKSYYAITAIFMVLVGLYVYHLPVRWYSDWWNYQCAIVLLACVFVLLVTPIIMYFESRR